MNKKEREQLLRDTLEQGLSALDSLPSDRAEVNRRLAENAPEIRHRIRFRRLAVPAVALALCVCLVITGTQLGMIPWPDRIRPQETQVTTPPVLLAQPTGEGTENPESPAGEELVPFSSLPAEAREETENLFAGFFNAWKTNNINAMLDLCSPLWVSAQEGPKVALFNILQNRTPSDFIIESISGTSGDTERMVSTVVTMNYNNNKPETDFRMNVRMIREDGAWYIDPESLVSFQRNTTPEPEAAPGLTALPQTGDPAVAEAEPDADAAAAEKYLREFFAAWHSGHLSEMYGFSGIGPFDPDHFASANTFNYLKSAYTPGEPEIESISGSAGDPVRRASVVCRMTDSSSFSGLYRFMIDMPLQEDGLRRLDFRSLQSFDLLADHSRTVLRPVTWPYVMAMSMPYTLADSLVPLNLVSEKAGLRFEAIAAAATSDKVMLLWSLQGSGENWGDPLSASVTPEVLWSGLDNYNTSKSIAYYYDRLTKTCTVAELVWLKTPLKGENDTVTVSLGPVPVVSCETIDLLPYYTQYGSSAQTVDMLSSLMIDDLDNFEQYVRTAPHVLDYRHPLDIRLSDHILLGGIGDVDGLLHVQLHYTDNKYLYPDPSGSITCRKSLTSVIGSHALPRPLQWSSDRADSFTDGFIEYVLQPDPEGSGIPLIISTTTGYIQGGWSVDVPLSAIRTEDEDSWPSEAREEIEYKFAGFFEAWKTGSMDKMLELCSPLWVSAQENPQAALFNILQNRTPSEFIIGSISGTPLDTDRMVSAIVTVNYNNNKPETDVRMNVRMIREKSAWYVDPESLVSYKRIIEEAPFDPVARLRELNADCPADFVPVGLSCEKEGFRLELVYASVNEQSAFLIWSLQDLEGDRINSMAAPVFNLQGSSGALTPPYGDSGIYLQYDESGRKLYLASETQYDTLGSVSGDDVITASMSSLELRKRTRLSIGGLLRKYAGQASYTDLPELLPVSGVGVPDGEEPQVYVTDDYRSLGLKVLDYTHPLSVSLHKYMDLSGIGVADGHLHVQLHLLDNWNSDPKGYPFNPILFANVSASVQSIAGWTSPVPAMQWDTNGDGETDFIESVFSCSSVDEGADNLIVDFIEITDILDGSWTIEVPLEKVWTGDPDADFLKTKAPEDIESWITQFFGAWELGEYNYMLDNCSPSWVSAQENPRQALFGNILVNRVPSSVTVESVSGSDEDAERMVTVLASMDYHNNKPDVEIRLNVRIVREDGAWYVDPNSLVSHRVITTPEPEAEPAVISIPDDSGFRPCESPRSLDQIPLDLLLSLRPDLKDDLFLVNMYWTNGGPVRLEVISAAIGETESWVIYTIENGMPRDQYDLANGLDDSPLPESDITEHYLLGMVPALNEARFAARIRHSTPDPERKSVVFSVSDIDIVMRESIDNMKSLFLIYEPLSGGLADLPKSADYFTFIMKNGEDITPGEFRKSGGKVLDSAHSPKKYLSNGLELSGIGLEEDGMLHIQLHTVERKTGTIDGISYAQLYSWYLHIDYKVPDRGYSLTWTDPEAVGEQTYFEYIIPWTMEDFDRYSLRLDLFEKWSELPDPVTLDISRPE